MVSVEQPRAIDWKQTDLYRFFAFAFGPPNQERHCWFSQSAVPCALAELWQQLSGEAEFPGFDWFPDFHSYEAAYIALFDVGMPEPPVPLFESAHDKRHPAQELVLENTYFYDVLGLRVDASQSVPDHLVTQLEFLSAVRYAQDQSPEGVQKRAMAQLEFDFLQRHLLNWIGTAEEKIRRCPFPCLQVLFSLMTQQLRGRCQFLAAALS